MFGKKNKLNSLLSGHYDRALEKNYCEHWISHQLGGGVSL